MIVPISIFATQTNAQLIGMSGCSWRPLRDVPFVDDAWPRGSTVRRHGDVTVAVAEGDPVEAGQTVQRLAVPATRCVEGGDLVLVIG